MNRSYSIAFVGMGSIGCRHFSNLCELLDSNGDSYTIDLYRHDITKSLPDNIANKVSHQYHFGDNINEQYDIVFVTNPTVMHYDTIKKFIDNTKAFFLEKPAFSSYNVDLSFLEKRKDVLIYVACPLRYTSVLQYVKKNVDINCILSVRAISSSYLPDWRPGQDYRKCYSAHKSLGGGVAIDLIHEWDYITYLFGMPNRVFSIKNHSSTLDIDCEDVAVYIASIHNIIVELHLDYFGRKPIRCLELFLTDDVVRCDLIEGNVVYLKSGKKMSFNEDRNVYQIKEIKHFFDIYNGILDNDNSINDAINVLKLSNGVIDQ